MRRGARRVIYEVVSLISGQDGLDLLLYDYILDDLDKRGMLTSSGDRIEGLTPEGGDFLEEKIRKIKDYDKRRPRILRVLGGSPAETCRLILERFGSQQPARQVL
jgi:hypothetical protein